jgi:hypothetical protein
MAEMQCSSEEKCKKKLKESRKRVAKPGTIRYNTLAIHVNRDYVNQKESTL